MKQNETIKVPKGSIILYAMILRVDEANSKDIIQHNMKQNETIKVPKGFVKFKL